MLLSHTAKEFMKNFSSPHVHIQSLDSASTPAAFAKREVELGTGALVVTDHGSLAACHTVYELAKKNKLIPVLGLEGYFRDDDCSILNEAGVKKDYPRKPRSKDPDTSKPLGYSQFIKYHHITLGFQDYAAFQTGVKLLSHAPVEQHGSEAKPLFNWRDIEELGATNTTMTTGCLIGMVQRFLLDKNDPALAVKYYEKLRSLVKPGNLYVEVFPHICTHNWVEGVFLTLKDGDGYETTRRYYAGKTLKTNVCEIKAEDLAAAWGRKHEHTQLIAVKNRSTWEDFEPLKIVKVHHDTGSFTQNECGPYAPGGDVQLGANKFMVELANKYGDPILVSDDAHYAHPEEHVVQDVRLAQSGNWRFYGSYHRQSSAEAYSYFSSKLGTTEKEFEGWVENSHAWVQTFKDFKFETKLSIPTKFYETEYAKVGAKNSLEYTLHLVRDHGRMDWADSVRVARLEQEIKLLYQNGVVDWLPYFMIAEEVCRLYRDAGLLTGPGRGSAAGLSLAYYLGITHVDPMRYGLSVDRFLTLDRILSGKNPDIDQDLPHRDLLVGADGTGGWLQERFGDHVAQISTIMTLKLKSAVLDVARFTLGAVPREIAELAHAFELPPQGLEDYKFVHGYEDSGSWVAGSITYDPALQKYVAQYPEQWKIVQKCLGLGRGVSRHACAFLIANRPIWEFVPLTKISDIVCTQFTAGAVEAVGGLKMDFLIVNSLNDISNAIGLIQGRHGKPPAEGLTINKMWVPALRLVPHEGGFVDIWDLPSAQQVFKEISTGKTETVFQFNTPGAVQWLRHFGHQKLNGNYAIDSIEAMAAFTALDRPGPLDAKVRTPGAEDGDAPVSGSTTTQLETPGGDNTGVTVVSRRPKKGNDNGGIQEEEEEKYHNMLVEYARRSRGLPSSPDIFVVFDRLFPETHGVMVYQEQLQRLYQEVTGCTGAQAEEFRGNVAKKKKDKIIAAYPGFIEGATKTLGSKEDAEAVWQFIQSWAAYGFNKSHAICYVVIAYACAFLKHHYPLEWWCAVLKNATKKEINERFWKHAGHLIRLPDVTRAHQNFEIVDERIQAPLSLLDGVGPQAQLELVACAPYANIADFIAKREAWKVAHSRTEIEQYKDEDGMEYEEEKVVKGRSALNDGIAYRLIVSGAMDSLFPNMTTLQALAAFEQAVWDHAQLGRKKPSKKPPAPIRPEYADINPLSRYQLRKKILPAYSEPLAILMAEQEGSPVYVNSSNKLRFSLGDGQESIPVAMAREWNHLQGRSPAQYDAFQRVILGYVEGARIFEHGEKDPVTRKRRNPKPALELIVDIGSEKVRVVKWPDRETGRLDEKYVKPLEGALVAVEVAKYHTSKNFTIQDIHVIQPPLGEASE